MPVGMSFSASFDIQVWKESSLFRSPTPVLASSNANQGKVLQNHMCFFLMHAEGFFQPFFTLLWAELVIPLLLLLYFWAEIQMSTRTVFAFCILLTFSVVAQGLEINSKLTKSSELLQLTRKNQKHILDNLKRAKPLRRKPSRQTSTMEDEEEAAGVQHKPRAKLRKGQKPNIIFILADDLGRCSCIFGERRPNDPRHRIKRYLRVIQSYLMPPL